MRSLSWATCVFALLLCGCFNPRIKSGGFACSSTDPDPCPAGFFCVGGVCQDHPGSGGAGGGVGGVGGGDLAVSVGDMTSEARDMSSSHGLSDMTTPADLEPAPPDMLKCKGPGSFCLSDSTCCSGTCGFFSCN